MAKLFPLICKHCGWVLGQARRAQEDKRGCGNCGRQTIFTIQGTTVSRVLAPPKAKRKREARRRPPQPVDFDRLMRTNRYVDAKKC